ncbi:MAG: methionyl-tRNA formyltransferase [Candidatus Aminicenantes bacterium]|nr:methionyl-tRNA formyltransferase [Candidatus Aminicenantes bacterium]
MANGDIVFYGTAAIGLPILHVLHQHHHLSLIVTQPDARGGRNRQVLTSPVKRFALENNIPMIQPISLRETGISMAIGSGRPLVAVAVAYGQFIPRAWHTLPRFKTVNVHFSLLPAYRGAAPVQRAIENGEERSGITIFEISGRMDAGDIWGQKEVMILPVDTCASYQQRLGELAAPFLLDTLEQLFAGRIEKRPQDDSSATLAPPVKKNEGLADWNLPARRLADKLRAFTPWPGLFFRDGSRLIKIIHANAGSRIHQAQVGDILSLDNRVLQVACNQGSVLEITAIQPEGKKEMSPWQYSLGNRFPARLA